MAFGGVHAGRAGRPLALPAVVSMLALVPAGCASGPRPVAVSAVEVPLRPAAVAPQPAPAAEQATGVHHPVEPRQTLFGIARGYGISVEALASANRIDDPDVLEVGQSLFVPGATEVREIPVAAPAPEPADLRLVWPVVGGDVTSAFGAPRGAQRHKGIDIRGRPGQLVLAADGGRVIYSGGSMRGYGKAVIIDHGEGLSSLYAHNAALLVDEGQRVERGQSIARVGRTGNASIEHCHFEVRQHDVPVNPLRYTAPEAQR